MKINYVPLVLSMVLAGFTIVAVGNGALEPTQV